MRNIFILLSQRKETDLAGSLPSYYQIALIVYGCQLVKESLDLNWSQLAKRIEFFFASFGELCEGYFQKYIHLKVVEFEELRKMHSLKKPVVNG